MRIFSFVSCWIGLFAACAASAHAEADFLRDVRPILAQNCFKCHGPDDKTREGGLRLDLREAALAPADSGQAAIVPGQADKSELVRRILSADESEVMPPPASKKPLTAAQKETLRQWIAAGAEYRPHWAFAAPKQAALPAVKQADWPRNEIDAFVLARLEAEGLQPSPEADRYALVRRASLDLIGLPPTPEETDAFIQDQAPGAYERMIDRLLSSPHYGERWARRWLDLARYADTNGYEKDRARSMWPYRDWVIQALNDDLPFDRFTIEQIAGDVLPGATLQQRIATGFHRNTMINEEGGIDPREFRFYSMVDRVNTTGTVWLGLTLGCVQCHTHKYDPIVHREYYQLMAFLNNAEEPELPISSEAIAARRAEVEAQARALEASLADRFPIDLDYRWQQPQPAEFASEAGAKLELLGDQSLLVSGENPDADAYSISLSTDAGEFGALRLEALTDPSLGHQGPGRTPHGNFVLSELTITAAPRDGSQPPVKVEIASATADFSQDKFPVADALDGNPKTGWGIHGPEPWNVNRTATFQFKQPLGFAGGTRWSIRLDQRFGGQHTLGRLRLSLGELLRDVRPPEVRRRELVEQKFNAWLEQETSRAVRWTVLRPVEAKGEPSKLYVLEDGSVFANGDMTKRDIYSLKFASDLRGITALRLETLPDERLPKNGPGRVYYEGPFGDFFLSEFTLASGGKPAKFRGATQSFAGGGGAAAAIDGDPLTGWSINGGQGRAHQAVFALAEPLEAAKDLTLELLFEKYFAAGLGRFRVSATTAPQAEARGLPAELEALLLAPAEQRTAEQRQQLFQHYLSVAPELAGERKKIKSLRDQAPAFPTTLVMQERVADNPRQTFIHKRGEYLQPTDLVEPDTLSFMPRLPDGTPRNRLAFAQWLVDEANPLTARVTVNRHWAACFGKGIVKTTEDFGFQGELPTHPELLDWLAVEFMKRGWSVKQLHRLIVTSATYRQASRVSPALVERDPENRLLARGLRVRLEAELIRDAALRVSGLLTEKLGGPSVFPPQPASVTTEGAYGSLAWAVTDGPDRYRRGLYTFTKRTAPYAMFLTFDAPSGEACVPRREMSNTPLQALTILNDTVFVEAAQALGGMLAARPGEAPEKMAYLFRRCLVRPAAEQELATLVKFYDAQRQRLAAQSAEAAKIAGPGTTDPVDRAAWTVVARAVLNLDEMITKD